MLSEKQKQALRYAEFDTETIEIFYGGAAGSGKSFLGCFWQITRRLLYPGTRGFIGRNTLADFKLTTYKTFLEVWDSKFKNNPDKITININLNEKIISFSNGSEILVKDLSYNSSDPEFNTLGGMELTDAFIDEVPEITRKAKEIIRSRIRFKLINDKPVLMMSGNPTPNWVKYEYIQDKEGVPITLPPHVKLVSARLSDNPDKKFGEIYRKTLETMSPYDIRRLLDGDWDAVESAENPFLYAWRDEKHISTEAVYNKNLPTYFSVDFNVSPLCALVIQHQGRVVNVVDEIVIEKGSIEALCDRIEGYGVPKGLMRICGDAMGNGRTFHQRDNSSAYMQMRKILGLGQSQFKLVANPTHKNSRIDCNAALVKLDIRVHPRCKGFIFDAKQVQCDADSKILKSNRNKLEQRADLLDDFRYFVNAILKKQLL